MFKKPTLPGKENVVAARPRLGLSSLQHSAKMKVENDIESAGASLKVLSVENSRQKVTSTTATIGKPKIGSMANAKTTTTTTNGAIKVNGPRVETLARSDSKSGLLRKDQGNCVASIAKIEPKRDGTADKTEATNETQSKPQAVTSTAAPTTVDPKTGNDQENSNNKQTDSTAAQQTSEKPQTIKKMGSWELSNFDIGRPLGRGKLKFMKNFHFTSFSSNGRHVYSI